MTNFPMLFIGVMIASAPMIIAYVFLQRYFIGWYDGWFCQRVREFLSD
ncbi:hypothetical protein [Halobacillus mangrovi]